MPGYREPIIRDDQFLKKYKYRWATPTKVDDHKKKGYKVVDEAMLDKTKAEAIHRRDGAFMDEGGHILMARTLEVAINHENEMKKQNALNAKMLEEQGKEIESEFNDTQKTRKKKSFNMKE